MMKGGLWSDLALGGVEGRNGRVGLYFSDWAVSVIEGWDLVFEFGQGFPWFGPWLS